MVNLIIQVNSITDILHMRREIKEGSKYLLPVLASGQIGKVLKRISLMTVKEN